MIYISIDKTIKRPLYQQIYDDIKHKINFNLVKHMDILPSEKQFAQIYDISSFVVKRAYKMLKDEGLIKSIKGRGTYIYHRKTYIANVFKPETVMFPLDRSYQYVILNIEQTYPSYVISNSLKTSDKQKLMTMKIVILSNQQPICYAETAFINHFDINLDDWLRVLIPIKTYMKLKLDIDAQITTSINAANADMLTADLLKIEHNSPIVIVQSVIKNMSNPLGYIKVSYPGKFLQVKAVMP